MPCGGLAIDIAHEFHAQHTGDIVEARFDISNGREHGHAARGTGGFVAVSGQAAKLGDGFGDDTAEHALA